MKIVKKKGIPEGTGFGEIREALMTLTPGEEHLDVEIPRREGFSWQEDVDRLNRNLRGPKTRLDIWLKKEKLKLNFKGSPETETVHMWLTRK